MTGGNGFTTYLQDAGTVLTSLLVELLFSKFRTPKLVILHTSMGTTSNFRTPNFVFSRDCTPLGV